MAKPVTVTISHDLGVEGAKSRIQSGFGMVREKLMGRAVQFNDRWEGDAMVFDAGMMGQKVQGRLDVFPTSVRIEVALPWLLAGMAEKLAGRLQKEGQVMLEKK